MGVASRGSSVRACFSPTTECAASAIAAGQGQDHEEQQELLKEEQLDAAFGAQLIRAPDRAAHSDEVRVVAQALARSTREWRG